MYIIHGTVHIALLSDGAFCIDKSDSGYARIEAQGQCTEVQFTQQGVTYLEKVFVTYKVSFTLFFSIVKIVQSLRSLIGENG